MILYIPLGFPISSLIHYNTRYAIILGAFLNCLGAWIRVVGGNLYEVALLGQTVTAIAQPFALNAKTKLASVW